MDMRLISKHPLMLGTNSGLKENVRKEARSIHKLRQWQTKFLHKTHPDIIELILTYWEEKPRLHTTAIKANKHTPKMHRHV